MYISWEKKKSILYFSVVATLARQSSFIEKIAADISVTWWHIMIMLLITAVISFLWTIIMRLFGPLLIWATIFFVVTSLTAGIHQLFPWLSFLIIFYTPA